MKKKQNSSKQDSDIRTPSIPQSDLSSDNFVQDSSVRKIPSDLTEDDFVPAPSAVPPDHFIQAPAEPPLPDDTQPAGEIPTELVLGYHSSQYRASDSLSDDPSEDEYADADSFHGIKVRKSRTDTLYEPRQKRRKWIKPIHLIISLAVIVVVVLGVSLFYNINVKERYAKPMTLQDEYIDNAEFSFMYHYVLIENAINIFDENASDILSSPGEDNFRSYREYFLDMAAREIQVTELLYDDAISKGYQITESQRERAQAYTDWLSGKAADIGVDLNTYIKGYYGSYVTPDLIRDILAKRYFTEDYANGPKLDELEATPEQAEDAYAANPYQYDQVSYRVLRIVFEQAEDSFKATAHLRAQEIIDGIGHDQSKFESVAANFFTGEAKDKILEPDSTLISNVRYTNIENEEWRAWLFDTARQPGDCTIFDDTNGFPILICFSARTRQIEPLRDIRFLYINREDTSISQAGIPDSEILPFAQAIFDTMTNEVSMQTLETTYADEIADGKLKSVHNSNTYQGVLENSVDTWIFDRARAAGDKTIIETETQIIIVFYVGASKNPEWYDRVNSFIRMNNYQAFLLEKGTEYPYTLNEDGLQYIKDVP